MDESCSRRKFLKKFAYLSGGALLLSATAMACYGPPSSESITAPEVSSLTFLDALSQPVPLRDNQSVPINTAFTIEFSKDMKTTVPATVELADAGNNAVAFSAVWYSIRVYVLTPTASLAHDTAYRLRVLDAEDAQGFKLFVTSGATADFKTIVA